jgi:hypothetical protein
MAGEALLYSPGGDGGVRVRILLEEAMSAAFQAKACERRQDLLLKIPSGRLFLCGIEDLGKRAEHYLSGPAGRNCTLELPPGDYLADASELDWGEEPDALAAAAEKEIVERGVSPGRRRFTMIMGIFAGLILFGSPVALAVAGLGGGWLALFKTVGVIAALYAVFAGIVWSMARHPSEQAYGEALRGVEEIHARFLDVVIQLKRLPPRSDPANFKGGQLGTGKNRGCVS